VTEKKKNLERSSGKQNMRAEDLNKDIGKDKNPWWQGTNTDG
jgi:hypothetical protein